MTQITLFAGDVLADSEKKLCRPMSEFGYVCERRKLRANMDMIKVMRYSTYENVGRMNVRLIDELL